MGDGLHEAIAGFPSGAFLIGLVLPQKVPAHHGNLNFALRLAADTFQEIEGVEFAPDEIHLPQFRFGFPVHFLERGACLTADILLGDVLFDGAARLCERRGDSGGLGGGGFHHECRVVFLDEPELELDPLAERAGLQKLHAQIALRGAGDGDVTLGKALRDERQAGGENEQRTQEGFHRGSVK
jgi:hypothetical protein